MNILTQLLPGLRDLRTPAAVGVLWALAGLIGYTLLPSTPRSFVKNLAEHFKGIFDLMPSTLGLPLGVFCIYLLGIAMAVMGDMVLILLRRIVNASALIVSSLLLLFAAFVYFLPIAAGIAIIALWLSLNVLMAWAERKEEQAAGNQITLLDAAGKFWRRGADALSIAALNWRTSITRLDPRWSAFVHFAREDTLRQLADSPALLAGVVARVPDERLMLAASRTHVPPERMVEAVGISPEEAAGHYPDEEWRIEILAHDKWREFDDVRKRRSAGQLRDFIYAAAQHSSTAREALLLGFTKLPALRRENVDQFREIHVRLATQHEKLYIEYDRAQSEAEFRAGVAMPLAAAAALLGLVLVDLSSLPSWYGWISIGPAVGLLIIFIMAADRKAGDAFGLLHASIRQGLIVLPEARRLTPDDLGLSPPDKDWNPSPDGSFPPKGGQE